ncbi:MAG: PhnD/SsuA/transferrin family substrate-binding protein [Caldimicrobium sp.]
MKFGRISLLIFFLFQFIFVNISLSFPEETYQENRTYFFGILAKRGEKIEKNRFYKLKEYLKKTVPYPIEFQFLPFDELKKRSLEGKIHFILTNPYQAITIKELAHKKGINYRIILSIGQFEKGDYYPYFGGVIFTKKGSSIKSLSELKGKTFGAVDPESFGGYLIALYELKKVGINEEELKVKFYGTHDAVVFAVIKGEVEAGTVRTGVLERLMENGEVAFDDIKILNQKVYPEFPLMISSPLYPEWPILALEKVPQEVIKSLAIALLDIEKHSDLAKSIEAVFYLPFDYSLLNNLLLELMKGPYAELKEIYFQRFKEKTLPYVLIALVIIIFFLAFLAYSLAKKNKELKTTKLDLEREKAFLDTVLRHTDFMVFYLDLEGRPLWANQKGERVCLNVEKEALDPLWMQCPILESLKSFRESFAKVLEEKTSVSFIDSTEVEGLEKTYEGEFIPLIKGNTVSGILFFLRDITEKVVLEKQKIYLEKLNVLKNVAGGLAHDFNNNLLGVMNQIELLKVKLGSKKLSGEIRQLFEKIQDSLLGLRILGRELLTLVRGEAPIKEKVNIGNLIMDYTALALSGKQNYVVEYLIENPLPALMVDKELFAIMWMNLVLNAIEAMPGGGKITVKVVPVLKNGVRYLQLSISDEGDGIPEKYKTKIFEPFFTTKPGGSGLGLYVVKEVVKAHDGDIRIESEEKRGTTVVIELPALNEEIFISKSNGQSGKKILIMDDDDQIRETLKELLENFGYEVETAPNGEAALDLYWQARNENRPFNYIILDLIVPGKFNGFEVFKKIREVDQQVKVMVMSGYFDQAILHNYKEYGIDGALVKPFTFHQLLELLEK